jgi:hypothetical protein
MSIGAINGLSPSEVAATTGLFEPGRPGDSDDRTAEIGVRGA